MESRLESRTPSYAQGRLDGDSAEHSIQDERGFWGSLFEALRRWVRRASGWKGI